MSVMKAAVRDLVEEMVVTGWTYNILGSVNLSTEQANYIINEGELKHKHYAGKFIEPKPGRLQFVLN